jgi:hypothetical protein
MRIRIGPRGAVDCCALLHLPLSATSVWGQIRDFPRYAQQDFFHADIKIAGDLPRAGAAIELTHRYCGLRFARVGRILVWKEGVGYSFSDLSPRGPKAGFPHIFSYRLEAMTPSQCRLEIRVRGLWTARSFPRALARLWLWWVFSHVVRSVRNELLQYGIWRKRRPHKG